MNFDTFLGAMSVGIGVVAYAIYISQATRKEGVQPHPFSWLLWGLVTGVAFLVQHSEHGGAGSWVTGFTALVCFVIGGLSLAKNRWQYSRFDWASLFLGVCVLAFYIFVRQPVGSAIFATAADLVGYGPTIKKGWRDPHKDSVTSFALNGLKFLPSLFALGAPTIATWLYPTTLVIVNVSVAVLLVSRRSVVSSASQIAHRSE